VAEIVIRVAGEGDVAALARLRREWTEEQDGVRADPDFEERFAAWYAAESGRRVCWLAEVDGRPVGMVNLAVFTRMPRPGQPAARWGYLGNAFVVAGHRDLGIGARLVAALLNYADEQRFARVVLSPSERSVPFYQRAGFGPADMLLARESGH
jgi:GNAT superfamily N-acetyltransferase